MTEQDDGENWGEIGRNLTTSPQVRRHALNYQMGLGKERDDDPDYPGRILPRGIGDAPQRGFYRRWLEYLTSESWPAVESKETAKQLQGAARS
jgi:3-phenylpropionate/trans-cinnamate dioxygenase alpha subunit